MKLIRTRRVSRRLGALLARVTTAAAMVGTLAGVVAVGGPAVAPAAAATPPETPGYWLASSDGGVYSYDAQWLGAMRGTPLNRPVVGAAATPDGQGYWLVGSDGGVFSYGDAHFYGSTGNLRLNRPIVAMTTDPTTGGYWFVASDGGVFSYNAAFYGSTGNLRLNQPIVGMAPTPDGHGYWLVASDGGIFSYGDAHFYGSTGGIHLARPIVAMAATSDGRGYWLAASDGGVFTFGDAPFLGSAGGSASPAPFTAFMTTSHGSPGATHGDGMPVPGTIGYDVSQWQCGKLPAPRSFAVVQVSDGALDAGPNPCYRQEAAWAGQNMAAYVFGDGLPSPAPAESFTGPAGACSGNAVCEGYNFGYFWARHWVAYSAAVGVTPAFWWFDVESGYWGPDLSVNAAVIRGAMAGLRSAGSGAGVYSTGYQWPRIAGSLGLTGVPLWVAGADYVSGDTYSASSFCANSSRFGFAGGRIALVQYGYTASGPAGYDPDYACP